MTEQKTSSLLLAGRVLGILTLIFSLLSILVFGWITFQGVAFLVNAAANPEAFEVMVANQFTIADALAELGLGTTFTEAQAAWLFILGVVVFVGCGLVFSLVMLGASVSLIRVPSKPENAYRTFVWAVCGGIMAFVSLRFFSALLLITAGFLVRKDFVIRVGEDVEYANIKHMGAMRVVTVLSVANLICNAVLLIFITHSSVYNAAFWVSFVQMLLMAVVVWVLVGRRQYGCQIIMASVGIYLVIDLVVQLVTGSFRIDNYLASVFWPVVMLIYFATSKRAKAVLVQPFHQGGSAQTLTEEEALWNPKSRTFWRNLLLYFCIFSVVGHWMEYGVCWLIRLGLVPGTYDPASGIWHDMLNPFFVYGAAFVFIGLLLYPFKLFLQKKTGNIVVSVLLSFVANTLFCAVIELAMGLAVNDHLQLWDYSTMAFNFMGQICLLNTTFFGVVATIMTWLVYPNLQRAFAHIPEGAMSIITIVVLVFFVLVVCMYVVNVTLPGNLNAAMEAVVTTYGM